MRPPHSLVKSRMDFQASQVVQIAAFTMHNLAKQTLLYHIHYHHLGEVIAAIFLHYTMLAGFFRDLDKFPAIFYCKSDVNF